MPFEFNNLPSDLQAHIRDMVEAMLIRQEEEEQRANAAAATAAVDGALSPVNSILASMRRTNDRLFGETALAVLLTVCEAHTVCEEH
jgi:hypothetical protein